MPRICEFYGIRIYMYRPDHPPPHFHAQYGEHIAQISLGTYEVLNGSLPARALRLVGEWAALHAVELVENLGARSGARTAGSNRPAALA